MAQAPHRVRYTRAEYIAFERSSNVKHEYLDGVIYAMAGGTPEHAAFAVNVSTLLSLALRDRPCRVHSSDLRIRVVDTGLETYPDVTVLCGRVELDAEDRNVVCNPIVVVEVTSPSTEEYDRGEKLEHYKRIPSLQEIRARRPPRAPRRGRSTRRRRRVDEARGANGWVGRDRVACLQAFGGRGVSRSAGCGVRQQVGPVARVRVARQRVVVGPRGGVNENAQLSRAAAWIPASVKRIASSMS